MARQAYPAQNVERGKQLGVLSIGFRFVDRMDLNLTRYRRMKFGRACQSLANSSRAGGRHRSSSGGRAGRIQNQKRGYPRLLPLILRGSTGRKRLLSALGFFFPLSGVSWLWIGIYGLWNLDKLRWRIWAGRSRLAVINRFPFL